MANLGTSQFRQSPCMVIESRLFCIWEEW